MRKIGRNIRLAVLAVFVLPVAAENPPRHRYLSRW